MSVDAQLTIEVEVEGGGSEGSLTPTTSAASDMMNDLMSDGDNGSENPVNSAEGGNDMPTGIYTIDQLKTNQTNVLEFGLENLVASLQADQDAFNEVVMDSMSDLIAVTTERVMGRGNSSRGKMRKIGEGGRGMTRKPVKASNVMFPLFKFEYAVGWTLTFFQQATVAAMAQKQIDAQTAYLRAILDELQLAIYYQENYIVEDEFVTDRAELTIRRFLNADGDPIPQSRFSLATFDPNTHTHYFGAETAGVLARPDVIKLIDNVAEHGHNEELRIYISSADETNMRNVQGFSSYEPTTILLPDDSTRAARRITPQTATRTNNRPIGTFEGKAEIWTKPWALPFRPYCADIGADEENKSLAMRQFPQESLQGLYLASENHAHPLYAENFEAYFGIAAHTRENGAVLDYSGTEYNNPA